MNLTGDSNIDVPAVLGQNSDVGHGVIGESKNGECVRGFSHNSNHGGVVGISDQNSGAGFFGICDDGRAGVAGKGVWGSDNSSGNVGIGVFGESPNGVRVFGSSSTGQAGFFKGNVTVTGDILLPGADCAEQFETAETEQIEPGTVVVIDREGALRPGHKAYDRRVAGVVSGPGGYRTGIVLDRQQSQGGRASVALVGKIYDKVDARCGSVETGALLLRLQRLAKP